MKKSIKFLLPFLALVFTSFANRQLFENYGKENYMNRIKMTFDNYEVIVMIFEGKSSEDFLKQLPLTLNFEDFAGEEKIAYLNRKLIAANENLKSEKSDFCYYAPWGNLAVFYKGYGNAPGLIKLGYIEEGKEYLRQIKKTTIVKIEKL